MGLDMYLTRRTYVQHGDHIPADKQYNITVSREAGTIIDPLKITYVIEQVGYWRKANQIHGWFVRNVQNGVDDCDEYSVTTEQLANLLNDVNAVLENQSLAKELLPPMEGFFFGVYEYDDDYFADLKYTKEILESLPVIDALTAEAMQTGGESSEFFYQSSW